MTVLSNLKDGLGRAIGGLGDGELQWHSDQSYMIKPATGAALYALELPPEGGETFWVDLRAAYAGLPRRLRPRSAGNAASSTTRNGSPVTDGTATRTSRRRPGA